MKKMVIVMATMMMAAMMSMTAFAATETETVENESVETETIITETVETEGEPEAEANETKPKKEHWYHKVGTGVTTAAKTVSGAVVSGATKVGSVAVSAGKGAKHGLGHAFIWCSNWEAKAGNWLLK